MPLKKHHKIIIGSFSSFLIILLIANSVFIYLLYGQLQMSYNKIGTEIRNLKIENQDQFSEIADSLLKTKEDIITIETSLQSVDIQISSIGKEFDELKASVSSDFSGIFEKAVESVMTIRTNTGQGTGFVVANNGYIITNYHVIENANSASVYSYDGKAHPVSIIGYNPTMDIALLKINTDYPSLKIADSDEITPAEKVIAIGNPYGLSFSVSEGVISAIHRIGPNGLNVYIQTTAELNSGNSGGPLINKKGEVIGMNNFKLSEGEGLGFALESNYIKSVANEIAQQVINQTLI
jgi:S1-C subfamily serine protease